jgi:iron complex outermembrane receptor protein
LVDAIHLTQSHETTVINQHSVAALAPMKTYFTPADSGSFKGRCFGRTPIATAVAVALYLKQPLPVYAADQAAELQEIVVTGTRREENIQNIPYNIAAVDSKTIEQLQLTKIDDLAHWVPGMSVQDLGSYGSSNIVLRGLNTTQPGASAAGPNGLGAAVAIYLGEVPLFFDFKLLDIDRVEVLLGPQGTLYGTGTLGGVIRYVPKEPNLSEVEGELHARLTAQDHATPQGGYDVDAVISVPLIDGQLGFRAVVGYFHEPGFINNTLLVRVPGVSLPQPDFSDPSAVAANLYTERGVNFDHTFTARATLLYRPNESFDAELGYVHERSNTNGIQVTHEPLFGTGPFDAAFRVPWLSDRKVDVASLVLTGHLGFADLVSASSFAWRRINEQQEGTDYYLGYTSYTNFPSFLEYDALEINRDLFTEELRLVSNTQSRLHWIVGGFYEHFRDQLLDHTHVPGYPAYIGIDRPDQVSIYSNNIQEFTDTAAFGELGYQLTRAWQVTVGGRWFRDKVEATNENSSPLFDGSPPDGFNLVVKNVSGPASNNSIFKFNTSYRFTPDLMLYATASEGYRAGGINVTRLCSDSVTTGCLEPDHLLFKPDRTRNYEVGMRSTWFDKRIVLNGDVYYIKWSDIKVPVFQQNGVSYIANGSAARSEGVELQFQAQIGARLQLLGSYSYNKARLIEPAIGLLMDRNGRYDGEPGDRLPGSPQQMGGLHVRYSQFLPGDYAFAASYGITAQSNIYSSIGLRASGEKIGGYALHDASLELSKNNWSSTFYVQNLLNKYAFTGMDVDRSWQNLTVDGIISRNYYHSILAPRQFGLEMRLKF